MMPSPKIATELKQSPLALGCWGFSDPALWGDTAESEAIATIHAALDHGIKFLDTAPGYGAGLSEEIVGKAITGRRDGALVATKVAPDMFSADGVRESLETSLRRLRTDHVDLLQIHWAGEEERFAEVIEAFESARSAGMVRACGVCNFGPKHLEQLREFGTGWITNQLPYNLLWRAIEFEITPACVDMGLGILAYSPLQQGLLTGKYATTEDVPEGRARSRHFSGDRELSRHRGPGHEAATFKAIAEIKAIADEIGESMAHVSIAWLRAQPGMQTIIVGATKPGQIADNARALTVELDTGTTERLSQATAQLKEDLGPNADMWAAESRYR